MSIPVYKEHILHAIEGQNLIEIFDKSIGEYPIVIHITHMREKQYEALEFIEKFVLDHELPYIFPYPIYIITSMTSESSIFKLFSTRNDLPSHYVGKDKKPNIKEAQIINKNKLYQKKIKSHFDKTLITYIEQESERQKYLYNLAKEGVFLETLVHKLNNPKVVNDEEKR